MNQFYSAFLSRILNHFARNRFLLILNNEFWSCIHFDERRKKFSVLAVSVAAMFFMGFSPTLAQDKAKQVAQSISQITGNWILNNANVMIDQQKVKFITKEGSFWSDHINSKIPLVIADDGSVTYSLDNQPAYARVMINNDNLVFIFNEEFVKSDGAASAEIKDEDLNASNFTIYKFRIQDDQLIISRNDPRAEEEYIFNRQ